MEKQVFEYVQKCYEGERKFTIEIGELAKQASGACLVRYNDTAVLSAAVGSKNTLDTDAAANIFTMSPAMNGMRPIIKRSMIPTLVPWKPRNNARPAKPGM